MSMKLIKTGLLGGAIALLWAGAPAYAQAQAAPAASAATAEKPAPFRKVVGIKTVMRDGVTLVSDVWLPAAEGKYPVLLMRSPYKMRTGRMGAGMIKVAEYFVSRGYAFVIQDARGTGDSTGEFGFLPQEPEDGYDSVESLAVQPWANGKLCMMGYSYLASVQWLAAKEKPPHLTCMAPTAPGGQLLDEVPSVGGAFMYQFALTWPRMVTAKTEAARTDPKIDWNAVLKQRPLLTLDEATGGKMQLYRDWLEHDTIDDYWKPAHLTAKDFAKINLPIMETTGWFDGDQPGTLFFWKGIEAASPGAPDRYLTIGPWIHNETFDGGRERVGDMKVSKDSIIDNNAMHLAFFDHYLKGTGAKPDWPRVRLFITGADIWRNFNSFPVEGATARRFYLSGGGNANTLNGDGTLTWDKPGKQPVDEFTFDPKNPVDPGGRSPFGADRTKIQQREDVLVYTSPVLTEAVEVIGPVAMELYAATDARDTDFTAAVSDVGPDGKAIVLGARPYAIIRARYRNGPEAKPSLLTPGKVERYTINMGSIGHRFLPGHRIRVEISSSNYPMFNPNQNTGNPIATDTEWKIAQQKIFHDSARPSALILPVFKQ